MSRLSKRLADLTPEQLAYLSRQLKEKGKANQSKQQIPRRAAADNSPLSYAQQRLWFIHQLDPSSPAYNVPLAVRLTGRLNLHAFQQALTEVVRRHESLRTRFRLYTNEPVQEILPSPETWPLPLIDLSAISSDKREAQARRLIEAEARRPFDLAQGPVMRTHLLRLSTEQHIVLLNMHHIVSDGWSLQVLFQEVVNLYAAFSAGSQSPLAELAVQYADYAEWQRGWLSGEALDEQLNWWTEQLRDAPPVLELPTNYVRPRQPTFQGAIEEVGIREEVVRKLRDVSRREGATLFMLLLAAWELLLWKYSGQEDVLIGTPVAGRQQLESEKLIGFFVNTLVVRGRLKDELSFRELLQQTRETVLDAHKHQDLPLEKLVETLPLERSMSHDPLFQVMFGFEQEMRDAPLMPGLKFDFMGAETKIAKFSLTLTLSETRNGIGGALEYATDLFDAATVRRLARQFETLLEAIAAAPDCSLARLPIMSDAEQYQLLQEWNDTATPYPPDVSLQQLFEAQAERAPDSIAVVYEDSQLTYAELNARANQLARRLRKAGVGPEVLVGIMVERGIEMLVGVLGIIKAGGGYVPLDANYPRERLAFMIDDTRAPVLLTQAALLDALPEHRASVICLDTDWPTIARESELNPNVLTKDDNLAYVIYTSGSTGRPKGVAVTHQAIKRLICNTDYVQLDSSSRIAQVSNFSFDAATFELWGVMLEGGCLVGISKEVALSPQSFASALREQAVTELFLTTALFNQIASEAPAGFASLRDLLFGGELVDARWVREVLRKGAPARLLHVYGPTETTTFATWQLVEEVDRDAATVPIGGPLANTTLYVLDNHYQPVPIGVAGQLYIGGDGLARGYFARPELTAEKFIPHPYSTTEGARLYSTGDRVRYLSDGSIEFLGRADQQVKVRGFRIELGEIETMLSTHPSVREAVVMAREDQRGDRRVVAYVTAKPDDSISIQELRLYLQQRLPDYMVPSAFVQLEHWPYTPSGKIDRRALPAPALSETAAEEHIGPRTQTEEVLAHIWAEVLKLERVSVTVNFFELGGHSLLATQIISRIRQLFHLDIPLRSLFESPTVAALAAEIDDAMRQLSGLSDIPPLLPQLRADADAPLILSYSQQRLWFIHQLEPSSPAYNVPLAVRLAGELNLAALHQAFTEVVRRHQSLRTRFFIDEPLQQILPTPASWPLPLIDL
ncbi:MAG: hypothetical protein QOF02_3505, partial [Blastocatellia bacterium]|nr:hypothetical protein [Blastocatellia bacterium]